MKTFQSLEEIGQKIKEIESKVDLGQKVKTLENKVDIGQKVKALENKVEKKIEDVEHPDHFNRSDITRNNFMLQGGLARQGYDWWWHSFTAHHSVTGEEKAFFVEFFTINPELGGKEPVLGQLPENKEKGVCPSYMMVKVGTWGENPKQLNRFFAWDDVTVKQDAPYLISADNCFCSETRTIGMVDISEEEAEAHPEYMSDSGRMYWDLTMDKNITFNVGYGAGKPLRDAEAFEMFWHCEGMRTAFEGKVVLDGEEYLVDKDTSYGYADKNWGKDFTSPWVWLASSHLTSKVTGEELKDSAFVIGGGRPKVGPLALENKLLSAMWYEGTAYEFNFSKFWTLTKTKFKSKETKDEIIWRVIQETPMSKMCTEIKCQKKEMLLINYEAPDGSKKHNRLWNGGNGVGTVKLYKKSLNMKKDKTKSKWDWELVDEISCENVGCEYGQYQE